MDNVSDIYFISHKKSVTFYLGTFTCTSSVQDLPIILKLENLQSLEKPLIFFIDLKFCKSNFYSLNRRKICKVVPYNSGSVYKVKIIVSHTHKNDCSPFHSF